MICVSVAGATFEECLEVVNKHELSEIRLDRLELKPEQIDRLFAAPSRQIATYRASPGKSKERLAILKRAIKAGATYVDIEIEAEDAYRRELVAYAREHNCSIIISYHDFEETPSNEILHEIVAEAFLKDAEIAKIACMVNSGQDAARLLGLLDSPHELIVVGMGEKGRMTRVVAPLLGSFCTFACLEKERETAPGQMTVEELKKAIKSFKRVSVHGV